MAKYVEEMEEKIKNYFLSNRHDVTFSQLYDYFHLEIKDLNFLEYILEKLVKNKFICKSECLNYFEYDYISRG